MGDVVRLPRKRNQSLRGAVREMVTKAIKGLKEPSAVILFVMAKDGSFAFRSASDGHWQPFDINSRAIAIIERDSSELIDVQ